MRELKLREKLGISVALLIALISGLVMVIKGGPSFSFNDLDMLGDIEWYKSFHIATAIYLAFHCVAYKKHVIHWLLPFLGGLVLVYDMHQYPVLHNVFTGAFIAGALHTIVFNTKESLKQWNRYLLFGVAAGGFLAGWLLKLYTVAMAELIVVLIIGISKEREQYGKGFMKFLNRKL